MAGLPAQARTDSAAIMNATISPSPANFDDPRTQAKFLPQYYPRANGNDAPPAATSDRNERIILDFVGAYYYLNCEFARLVELRKQPPSTERSQAERQCLQAV